MRYGAAAMPGRKVGWQMRAFQPDFRNTVYSPIRCDSLAPGCDRQGLGGKLLGRKLDFSRLHVVDCVVAGRRVNPCAAVLAELVGCILHGLVASEAR